MVTSPSSRTFLTDFSEEFLIFCPIFIQLSCPTSLHFCARIAHFHPPPAMLALAFAAIGPMRRVLQLPH
jgi:hypothetical protein